MESARWVSPRRPATPIVKGGHLFVVRFATGVNPTRNGPDSPAPTRVGWWAFPWPTFSWFHAHHKVEDALPKRLADPYGWHADRPQRDASLGPDEAVERRAWIRRVSPRVVRRHTMTWSGPVWAHVFPDGSAARFDWYRFPDPQSYRGAAKRFLATSDDSDFLELWLCARDGKPAGTTTPRGATREPDDQP